MKKMFAVLFAVFAVSFGFHPMYAQEMSRRDVLRYALDSEVSDLIDALIEENNDEYTEELADLFSRTKNVGVKERVFKLFAAQNNPVLESQCVSILSDPYEQRKSLVAAAADYAGELSLPSALPAVRSLVDTEDYDFASAAVRALGKAGVKEDAVFLSRLLDSDVSFGSEKQRLVFRQDVMAAISNLDASEIRGTLTAIIEDEDENVMIRSSAAAAIGKLALPDDAEILAELFGESDPVLRTAAVSALSNFGGKTAEGVVMEAFKDSYYKVRLEALNASEKMGLEEAVPYVLYRAKTDPVESVKLKSYEVLGKIGGGEGVDFLTETMKNKNAADKFRAKAAGVLLADNFDASYDDVEDVAEEVVSDEKKRWLCYEIGKQVAKIESPRTAGLASLYLASRDALTQSIGLDMYDKNRHPSVKPAVQALSENESAGAIQRRALKILEEDNPAAHGSADGGDAGGGARREGEPEPSAPDFSADATDVEADSSKTEATAPADSASSAEPPHPAGAVFDDKSLWEE